MSELYDLVAPFVGVAVGGFGQVAPIVTVVGDPTTPLASVTDTDYLTAVHPTNPANIQYRTVETQTAAHESAGVPRFHRRVRFRLRAKTPRRGDFFVVQIFAPFFAYTYFNIGAAYPGGIGYLEQEATAYDPAGLAAYDGEPMSVQLQNIGGDFTVSYAVILLDGVPRTHVRQRQRGAAEARARQRTTGRRTNQTSR